MVQVGQNGSNAPVPRKYVLNGVNWNKCLLGEYNHTIDDKGRLTIPAKFRRELAAGLVVTRGFDQNLMVFPIDGWQELAGTHHCPAVGR